MFLTKDGITVEVFHPYDIARYKKAGYVREGEPPIDAAKPTITETPQPVKGMGKGKVKDG